MSSVTFLYRNLNKSTNLSWKGVLIESSIGVFIITLGNALLIVIIVGLLSQKNVLLYDPYIYGNEDNIP